MNGIQCFKIKLHHCFIYTNIKRSMIGNWVIVEADSKDNFIEIHQNKKDALAMVEKINTEFSVLIPYIINENIFTVHYEWLKLIYKLHFG